MPAPVVAVDPSIVSRLSEQVSPHHRHSLWLAEWGLRLVQLDLDPRRALRAGGLFESQGTMRNQRHVSRQRAYEVVDVEVVDDVVGIDPQ